MSLAARRQPGQARAKRGIPSAQHARQPSERMEELVARSEVSPLGRLRLRCLADEREPDQADDRVSVVARQAARGVHLPLRHLRPARSADGAGIRPMARAKAVLVLLLGVRSVLPEFTARSAKTASQFTGCQRGCFGTTAASHQNGATVRANMVSGFLTALRSAVLAIENELGTVAARNYVRANGDHTVTGLTTFQD